MRATTISMLIAAALVGILGLVLGFYALFNRSGGKFWFFWIAPLLAIGFAGIMLKLIVGYWMEVGRLETKGRPRQ